MGQKAGGKAGAGEASPKGVRLQRAMADAGVASRRECEAMIESGRVEVNNALVEHLPVFIDPKKDRVKVDGVQINLRAAHEDRVYVILNKPDRTLASTRDGSAVEGNTRTTVVDLVEHPSNVRLYPIGRLDYHATGMILLTNDGELTQRLTHARYGVTQTWRVWVAGSVNDETLDMLRRRLGKRDDIDTHTGQVTGGVRVDIRPGDVRSTGEASRSTVLEITLREGRRESIGDMLLAAGCKTKKLVRVAVGPLRMRNVAVGAWRDLSPEEVGELRAAAGLALLPGQSPGSRTIVRSGSGGAGGGAGRGGSGTGARRPSSKPRTNRGGPGDRRR